MLAFAAAFDPQPAHLDEEAARATPLRGLSASGWHTCALVAHHLETILADEANYLGTASVDELRWLRPVRHNDKLVAELERGSSVPCICEPAWSRCPAQVVVRNGLGEAVVRWSGQMLFGRPPHDRTAGPRRPTSRCEVGRPRRTKVAARPGDHFIRYFEDVACGDEAELGSYTFDPRKVRLFERIVCAKPRLHAQGHVDDWNVVAACMRRIVDYYQRQAARLAAARHPIPLLGPATGVKWLRWPAPVSIGDQINFRGWVEHKINVVGTGRWGLLVAGAEGRNRRGELVVSFYPQFLLERSPTQTAMPTG